MRIAANVRLLGSIQLESGHAYCLASLDCNIDRGLQGLLPWSKEPAHDRIVVLHASVANLLPYPTILGERLAKAVVFASGRER